MEGDTTRPSPREFGDWVLDGSPGLDGLPGIYGPSNDSFQDRRKVPDLLIECSLLDPALRLAAALAWQQFVRGHFGNPSEMDPDAFGIRAAEIVDDIFDRHFPDFVSWDRLRMLFRGTCAAMFEISDHS